MIISWHDLIQRINTCDKCELCQTRSTTVPGEGDPHAALMFVGEGPGRDEDEQGRPFVGRAGQLLDKMIEAMGLERKDVYICNIVKCRPPQNRTPLDHEAFACLPYLREQFLLVRPKVIVCLGATAAKYVYDPDVRITRDRGKWICKKGVWMIPTYHPAALLRDPPKKREVWQDLQAVMAKLEELEAGSEGASDFSGN
jgi:DNA polymerase